MVDFGNWFPKFQKDWSILIAHSIVNRCFVHFLLQIFTVYDSKNCANRIFIIVICVIRFSLNILLLYFLNSFVNNCLWIDRKCLSAKFTWFFIFEMSLIICAKCYCVVFCFVTEIHCFDLLWFGFHVNVRFLVSSPRTMSY